MAEKHSFIGDLIHRRVPQLVGMYVAATWLVIELGDWTTERFNLSATVTTYVFFAMLTMLPAVILFSYNHGAPGKDRWTKTERVAIPLNVVVTLGVLYFLSPAVTTQAATEMVQIPDETGAIQEFEVARSGYHREVIGFFWRNESGDSEIDWLSYGLPLMLAHDMNRVSPVITVDTPFDSFAIRNELRNKGYPELLNEPQGLRVQIARDRRSAALITGTLDRDGDTLFASAVLVDVGTGAEIGVHTVSGNDWLTLVDDITVALLRYLDVEPSDNQSDDPVGQHFSDSLEAIRHYANGQFALDVNNDYPQGIAELQRAVELDPDFAEASGDLSMTHFLSNDLSAARAAATQALRNSYRLSETSTFLLKANRYVYEGDYDRGERVIEVWTQVQPNSTEAFRAMARISRMRGTAESLEKAVFAYDRLLELDPQDLSVLRQKAQAEQQRGSYEAAAGHLRRFLEQEPDNGDAHLQLAGVYRALGDLEAAQASLEDAAILSDNPLESEIGLARLEARRGFFDAANERLDGLDDQLNPQQQLQLLGARSEVAFIRGQIEISLALNSEINDVAESFMPPIGRLLGIQNQQTTLLALLGRTDAALAVADEITAQLQPPSDASMNITYAAIFDAANDREAYREVTEKAQDAREQIAPLYHPFIEMQLARVALWDEQIGVATAHLDRAGELLGQSILQSFQSNLSASSIHVLLAELYLEANAPGESRARLEEIMKGFPANAHAKLTYAKVLIAEGDEAAGRDALSEALEIWADADDDFVYRAEARTLLERL